MTTSPPVTRLEETLHADALWSVKSYRLSVRALEFAWDDVSVLARDYRCRAMADQMHRAVGSIGANIAEGYGRGGGRDRARLFEYALGSAREARHWYVAARPKLGDELAQERIARLNDIVRLLIVTIREERKRAVGTFK